MIIEFSKDLQLDDWMFADLHERFIGCKSFGWQRRKYNSKIPMITIHATSNEDVCYINFHDHISHLSSAYDQIGVSKFSDVEEIKSHIDKFLIKMSRLVAFA